MSERVGGRPVNQRSESRSATPTELVVAGALLLLVAGLVLSESFPIGRHPWPFAIALMLAGVGAASLIAAAVALGIRLAREQ